jgi:hypothetical protein
MYTIKGLMNRLNRGSTDALKSQGKTLNYRAWSSNLLRENLSSKNPALLSIFDYITSNYYRSYSQNYQDLIVSYLYRDAKNLYFCEIGACDGVHLSNTCLLEKELQWSGLLSEPNPVWHQRLGDLRTAKVDHRPVWSSSGETLPFILSAVPELSTFLGFADEVSQAKSRTDHSVIDLVTVSLNDLLQQQHVPQKIHFLSVDTEGSDFEILKKFDFGAFDVLLIVVEHNFSKSKDLLKTLLEENGYIEILTPLSLWDSWFVQAKRFDHKELKIEIE